MELTPRLFCFFVLAHFGALAVLQPLFGQIDSPAVRLTSLFLHVAGAMAWAYGLEFVFRRYVDRPKDSDAG